MRQSTRQAMAQEAAKKDRENKRRGFPLLRGLATFAVAGALGLGLYQAAMHPDTPLPREWNPVEPLQVSDPVTPITSWKLNRAAATAESCIAALSGAAAFIQMPDLEVTNQCHIRDRLNLRAVGGARLDALETRCAIALRMAMWEHHTLQPAAQDVLRTKLTRIEHFGSYSCRRMRTGTGLSSRMSTHATAEAIDISGFRFSDGRSVRLLDGWNGTRAEADFLRAARDGACDWFSLTLSPDYNRLHADHFHLQSKGWGLCR